MSKEKEMPLLDELEQGKPSQHTNIDLLINKSFDVPESIKGCFGEYEGVGDCIACDLRLGCARASAGGDNE